MLIKYKDADCEDQFKQLNSLIEEANDIICRVQVQLSIKFQSDLKKLNIISMEIENYQEKKEVVEDKTDKQLFSKIAHYTHPDKCGDDKLFKLAKSALKNGDRETLLNLLHCAKADYVELLRLKKEQYNNIIQSSEYALALDYSSGNTELRQKAERFYHNNVLLLINQKTMLLGTLVVNKISGKM